MLVGEVLAEVGLQVQVILTDGDLLDIPRPQIDHRVLVGAVASLGLDVERFFAHELDPGSGRGRDAVGLARDLYAILVPSQLQRRRRTRRGEASTKHNRTASTLGLEEERAPASSRDS